jgi:hypothetical protein
MLRALPKSLSSVAFPGLHGDGVEYLEQLLKQRMVYGSESKCRRIKQTPPVQLGLREVGAVPGGFRRNRKDGRMGMQHGARYQTFF